MVAILHRKRNAAQNSARIWERDLLILYRDHPLLQASFKRLPVQFIDLQARIQEDHHDFQLWRVLDCRP
jgi:hypothetical protein